MGINKTILIIMGLSVGLIGCQKSLTITDEFSGQSIQDDFNSPTEDGSKNNTDNRGIDFDAINNTGKLSDILAGAANDVVTSLESDSDLSGNLVNLLLGNKVDRVKGKLSGFFDRIISKVEEAKAKITKAKDKIQTNIDMLDPEEKNQAKLIKKLEKVQAKLDKVSAKLDKIISKLQLALTKIESKIDKAISKIDSKKWYKLVLIYKLRKMKDEFVGALLDRLIGV